MKQKYIRPKVISEKIYLESSIVSTSVFPAGDSQEVEITDWIDGGDLAPTDLEDSSW